jgi:hypothetical protein
MVVLGKGIGINTQHITESKSIRQYVAYLCLESNIFFIKMKQNLNTVSIYSNLLLNFGSILSELPIFKL